MSDDDFLESVLGYKRPSPLASNPLLDFTSPNRSKPLHSLLKDFIPDLTLPPLRPATLPPIPQRIIKVLTPQQKAERDLRNELTKMADKKMLRTLARILPSLNTLAFADGKEIETSILYIDIRKSSSITASHIAENAAKMYKMFHKAMIFAGKRYHGEIGGFAGDRIMIVFPFGEKETPKTNAVKTAIYMQYVLTTVLNPILNDQFKHPLECGIGVDFGKILVVRVGQQGAGNNERIWAGNSANYASKLADLGTGIYIGKNIYNGMNPDTLKTVERTWTQVTHRDGRISHYKYSGIPNPI